MTLVIGVVTGSLIVLADRQPAQARGLLRSRLRRIPPMWWRVRRHSVELLRAHDTEGVTTRADLDILDRSIEIHENQRPTPARHRRPDELLERFGREALPAGMRPLIG